jgi:predicted dehydrogenase
MTSPVPTVGIIGLGYGRAHISAFQANGCRVVALCQRDQAPPHLHHPMALRAFARGIHVLCEKPPAMSRVEAEAMVEVAR